MIYIPLYCFEQTRNDFKYILLGPEINGFNNSTIRIVSKTIITVQLENSTENLNLSSIPTKTVSCMISLSLWVVKIITNCIDHFRDSNRN